MQLTKKKILAVSVGAISLFAGLTIFTSCKNALEKDEIKVAFMVQNDSNEWKQAYELTVENNKVELPSVSKDYYTFANWYYDENFTTDVFTGKNITKSETVYARFVPIEVNVHINGVDEGVQNLVDVVNGTYNPGEDLEFDGWYTNSSYTTKWDNRTEANDLYAKSVARITFYDGYQNVYTTTVNPGTVYANPAISEATDKDGVKSTVEKLYVWKNYMSYRDISYVDEDGNDFDFDKPITKNTTIRVKWRSPFLKYQTNPTTGNLCVTMYGNEGTYDDTTNYAKITDVPAISILGEISFPNSTTGVVKNYKVDAVRFEQEILDSSSIKKLIIGEGIESIQNIISNASSLEEVELPSTLKVIQNSFNNLNKLKEITLPDGVEVIIGSFWSNTYVSHNGYLQYNKGDKYSFDIYIPESVKNLSMVPTNLSFTHSKFDAKNGDFYRDGDRIYKIDDRIGHEGDLILVSDGTNGTSITVPEGVKGIQVGTYFNRSLDYLNLPSTFSYVSYNEDISSYPASSFQYSSKSFLFDERYENDVKGNIAPTAYSIFSGMSDIIRLNIKQAAYPSTLPASAFIGDPTGYAALMESYYEFVDSTSIKSKVAYTGESDQPIVTVTYTNTLTGEIYKAEITKSYGDKLTIDEILTALDEENTISLKTAYEANKLALVSLKNFGVNFDIDEELTTNAYLDITFNYVIDGGYVAVENDSNGATITGFNPDTCYTAGDGLKIVSIPETVTIGLKTLKVTEIASNAFSDNAEIGYVILPSSLKKIGEKAFYNDASLKVVDMSKCSLEVIGKSAFEGTNIKTLTLALKDMKEIGAYAFKSESLLSFTVAEGEEDRNMLTKEDLTEGEFFFRYETIALSFLNQYSAPVGIYQYVSKTTVTEEESSYNVYDVKFVASCGAYNANNGNQMESSINLGDIEDTENIIRYEVMEGSYYYISDNANFYFASVSVIHSNAFTGECTTNPSRINYSSKYMGSKVTGRVKFNLLVNDENIASKFEENWYEGYTDAGLGAKRIYAM